MMTLKTRNIILILGFLLLTTTMTFSQTLMQKEADKELREAAVEKAGMWKDELGLTSKQTDLMQKKIVEFAIKKNRLLQSKMREEEKTKRLIRLQELENKDMRDILTKPQYDRYIMLLKKQIKEQGSKR